MKYIPDEYIFLMVPNNSGSTLLSNILLTSKNIDSTTPLEAQFNPDFIGPRPDQFNVSGLFTKKENIFRNESLYDWEHNKKEVFFSRLAKPLLIEKSPSNLCRADMYYKHFKNIKYLIMDRNPLAMAEGVMRQFKHSAKDAISHAVRCKEINSEILNTYKDISLYITYEELVNETQETLNKIKQFIPMAGEIFVPKHLTIKGKKYNGLINKNEEQISKISVKDLNIMLQYINMKGISL